MFCRSLFVFSRVRVTRSLVLYVCFVDRCLSFSLFSFGHCVVCSSQLYGFRLSLWYLQTLLIKMPLPSLESERSFICVLVGSRFGSFLQFSIGFWNCVVYFVLELFRRCGIFCFRTVPTVWYILFQNCSDGVVYFVLELFRRCGIFCFRTVQTVWYILFQNCSDGVVYLVLELFRQCGIFCFRTVPTVWYILFQNCSDSVVYFVLHFLSLKLLIIIYVFICASGILVRGEYHPSSSQCSDTDMVYQIYLFLTFTVLCNVIIIKSKVYRPSDIGHLLDFLLSTLVFELPIFF